MYIVINKSNHFDPVNTQTFETEESAEAKARELLTANPSFVVLVAQALTQFTASVEIVAEPVA